MNISLKGGASPFAHLFGRSPKAAAAKAKDEKEKDKDKDEARADAEEGDDEKEKKDEKDEKGEKGGKKGKKAEADSEDDDEEMSSEKDDEHCEDEEDEKKAEANGVSAERSRWVATLSNQAAAGKGEAAIHMLATTDMTSEQIVGVLGGLPSAEAKAGRRSLDDRMSDRRQLNPGAGGAEDPQEGPAATAKAMMAVYDRATGRASK